MVKISRNVTNVRRLRYDVRVMRPVFLVGAEQSGSTMLRLMLDSHPNISFAEEFDYSLRLVDRSGSLPPPDVFHQHLLRDRSFSTSGFTLDTNLGVAEQINAFLHQRQSMQHADIVGATLRSGFAKAPHLWPEASYIRLVRDPRSVAADRIAVGLAGNPWHAVEQWINVEDEWRELEATISPDRLYTVKFRDLVTDCHTTLTHLCRFLGVDYTTQMLDYSRDTDYRVPTPSLAKEWRDTLNPDGVRLVEARVGDRLQRNGYTPSGLEPIAISDRRRHWLRWHDRSGRIRGRMRSYGVRLTAADMAVRAIGTEPMQHSIRSRLHEVEVDARKKSWSNSKFRTSQ
jgi:hypothetical protein